MNDRYLVTIIQYLVKILENQGGSSSGVSDKLDEVIEAVSNIKISAESVNLNTDELEAKLDTINTNITLLKEAVNNGFNNVYDKFADNTNAINAGFKVVTVRQEESKQANVAAVNHATNKLALMMPTHLGIVAAGDTEFGKNVTLCNISNDNITITVTAAGDTAEQSIVLTPGWNPIVVKFIKGATANTLLYGY